jgi:diketogulonate reductase-like aldo/keto reductase
MTTQNTQHEKYDLFKTLPEGPLWIGCESDLDGARKKISDLSNSDGGQYFVYENLSQEIIASTRGSLTAEKSVTTTGTRNQKGKSKSAQGDRIELRRFGRANRSVAVIGQGTWYVDESERGSVIAGLRLGLDLGMNHIDTAEMYGSGAAEELVGEAIEGRRDEVFLVSQVLPQNASKTGTIEACECSLARLGTDRLDSYLLHWRGVHPLEETVAGFERLLNDGKILSWGVSNFDVADLEEVSRVARAGHVTCNQVLYHLEERAIEHAVLPWCEKNGLAVVAYSPFGHGRFPCSRTPAGRVLEDIARAHRATPRQVALRFLTRSPSTFAIPKASSPEHVRENAGAGSLRLTAEELARIDAAFPLRARRSLPVL